MASLQIKTGQIKIDVLDDFGEKRGTFSFNPSDILIAKKILELKEESEKKQAEWNEKSQEIDKSEDVKEKFEFIHEICEYMKNAIDNIYGVGTSKILFGNAETLDMFEQFFDGILPYYEEESKKRIARHTEKYQLKK